MSFLSSYFSSSPEIKAEFKKCHSKHYHSLILELGYDDFKTFFALNFYENDLEFAIRELNAIIEDLKSEEEIDFDGDAMFFFRPEFSLTKTDNHFTLKPLPHRNRSEETFEFKFPISKLNDLAKAFELAVKELKKLE